MTGSDYKPFAYIYPLLGHHQTNPAEVEMLFMLFHPLNVTQYALYLIIESVHDKLNRQQPQIKAYHR